jgi:uncharacterized DUF497 family protein
MHIEWDEAKDVSNRAKHGVSFELAARVFDDPFALSVAERIVDYEERWQTIGLVGDLLVLLVAHTWRDGGQRRDDTDHFGPQGDIARAESI